MYDFRWLLLQKHQYIVYTRMYLCISAVCNLQVPYVTLKICMQCRALM